MEIILRNIDSKNFSWFKAKKDQSWKVGVEIFLADNFYVRKIFWAGMQANLKIRVSCLSISWLYRKCMLWSICSEKLWCCSLGIGSVTEKCLSISWLYRKCMLWSICSEKLWCCSLGIGSVTEKWIASTGRTRRTATWCVLPTTSRAKTRGAPRWPGDATAMMTAVIGRMKKTASIGLANQVFIGKSSMKNLRLKTKLCLFS